LSEGKRFENSLNGPISGTKPYGIYDDDGDIVVTFSCFEYVKGPYPNPGCGGHFWRRSSDLILHFQFPAEEGQRGFVKRWKAPVEAAISFATKWRQ